MKRFLILATLFILGACSREPNDLKQFVRDSDKNLPRKIEPLPTAKPFEPFTYEGFDLPDPFKPRKLALKQSEGGGLLPDLNRRKEPLEAFPLEQLKVVGTLSQSGEKYALVSAGADKTLYRVKRGNYLGQNFGLITDITNSGIKFKEIVQDAAGDWTEQQSVLSLVGDWAEEQQPLPLDLSLRVVPILFATNREKSGSNDPDKYFLDEEAKGNAGDRMTLGRAIVRVPRKHTEGALEEPGWVRVTLEKIQPSILQDAMGLPKFKARDPEKYFTFVGPLEELTDGDFHSDLQKSLSESKSRSALLFVHGYANGFADAAYRTAQLTFDLRLEGYDVVPLMFSWPSDPDHINYSGAADRVQSAGKQLAQFLNKVAETSSIGVVHIIAHSMGAKVLGIALNELKMSNDLVTTRNGRRAPKFHQIILAAPDIRAMDFEDAILPAVASGYRVTNYASSNDAALLVSKKVNVGPRAGDSGNGLVLVKGVETIDSTAVNNKSLGHSYFAESLPMIRDLTKLMRDDATPEARGLHRVRRKTLTYWMFQ